MKKLLYLACLIVACQVFAQKDCTEIKEAIEHGSLEYKLYLNETSFPHLYDDTKKVFLKRFQKILS